MCANCMPNLKAMGHSAVSFENKGDSPVLLHVMCDFDTNKIVLNLVLYLRTRQVLPRETAVTRFFAT